MGLSVRFTIKKPLSIFGLGCAIISILIMVGWHGPNAYSAQLGNRQLVLDNNQAGAKATYQISTVISTASTVGSISISFCSNDPFPQDTCVAPVGFSDSAAVLSAQTGLTGFSITHGSSANVLILGRSPAPAIPGPVSFTFTGIINPSTNGSYFARVQTFATPDGSGTTIDFGGIAFAITNSVAVSAMVPPYLIFCTAVTYSSINCTAGTGNFLDFGEFSASHASSASSAFITATNAGSGFSVTANGTTMTSGNNVITALTSNTGSRPGTAQFGINVATNTNPSVGKPVIGPGSAQPVDAYNQANNFQFNTGDQLVSHSGTDNLREYTVSYLVNIPKDQAPGLYAATVTYICIANF